MWLRRGTPAHRRRWASKKNERYRCTSGPRPRICSGAAWARHLGSEQRNGADLPEGARGGPEPGPQFSRGTRQASIFVATTTIPTIRKSRSSVAMGTPSLKAIRVPASAVGFGWTGTISGHLGFAADLDPAPRSPLRGMRRPRLESRSVSAEAKTCRPETGSPGYPKHPVAWPGPRPAINHGGPEPSRYPRLRRGFGPRPWAEQGRLRAGDPGPTRQPPKDDDHQAVAEFRPDAMVDPVCGSGNGPGGNGQE